MPDALRLPDPYQIVARKRGSGYNDTPEIVNPTHQAATLRGVLAGLESRRAGLFATASREANQDGGDDEPSAEDLGTVVLKITGRHPFSSSGMGNWEHRFVNIAVADGAELIVFSDADSRAFFAELIAKYGGDPDSFDEHHAWRAALENVADIELFGREDRITPGMPYPEGDGVVDVEVLLWPTSLHTRGAEKAGQARVTRVRQLVDSSTDERVRVLSSDDRDPDSLAISARVNTDMLEQLLNDPLVEQVRGTLTADLVEEDLRAGAAPEMDIRPQGEPVGVIDDLVMDNNPWMDGVVLSSRSFPSEDALGDPTTHGTQVAAIAAWGEVSDLLLGDPKRHPHPIYAARIAHANEHGQPVVAGEPLRQVEDALRWLHSNGVRVVVFPFGDRYADLGALPSALASRIDDVARELNLVVVVSAGNITELPAATHWFHDYPSYLAEEYARIASPGTAALAVTVGSAAHAETADTVRFPGARGIAKPMEPSPFGRTGPIGSGSAAARQKPEFHGPGGNWAWHPQSGALLRNDPALSPVTLRPQEGGRLFSATWGTSYAAPRVAHEIATIADHYPDASANLLRALAALSGTPPLTVRTPQTGTYGFPNAAAVAESTSERAICVLEGEMATNSYQLIRLPIPEQFLSGYWDREIRVALAYDPPVRRSRRDYIAGHITFQLVRNHSIDDLRSRFQKQPTVEERKSGLPYFERPGGRNQLSLVPTVSRLSSDTLICRSVRSPGSWDVNDSDFFLVLDHTQSQWSTSQRAKYASQPYAIAVQLISHAANTLDLHALADAELRAQARQQARGRAR